MELLRNFLWAKSEPRKSLYTHMYEAAVTIRLLLKESIYASCTADMAEWLNLTEDETVRLLMYLAALHDLGKLHPSFQSNPNVAFAVQFFENFPEYINSYLPHFDYRHEKGSCSAAMRIWKDGDVFDRRAGKVFANLLSLHHQGKKGKDYSIVPDEDWDHPEWITLQDELEEKLRLWINPPQMTAKQIVHMDAACMLMTAMIILTDWITSSDVLSEFAEPAPEETIEQCVKTFLESAGMDACEAVHGKHMYEIWSWLKEDSMRPMQRALDDYLSAREEMPLLTILEAPMGEGKTEAGIYAALRMAEYWRKSGVYVGLPTAATANQMQYRINSLLAEHGIGQARLLHSMAWLNDMEDEVVHDTEGEYSDWLKPSKRALLSPWAVGTIDQAMMSVLQVKYGALRLLGLTGKVLVLDEIHAYDAYMSSIIKRLLEWCRVLRIPVVMMSATLPEEKRAEFLALYTEKTAVEKGYPLISVVYEDGRMDQIAVQGSYQHQNIRVELQKLPVRDVDSIADLAEEKIGDGGCLCILVNTVKAAQDIYRELTRRKTESSVMLFHSRFTAARRKDIDEECIRLFGPDHAARPERAILVATQVVEQSLDLDFDAMITEIAPVDLVLQRSGRLHRHKDTKRPNRLKTPVLTVMIPPEQKYEAAEMIYYPVFLNRTADILGKYPEIRIPEDIPILVNEVYQTETIDLGEAETFWEQQFQDQLKAGQAEAAELDSPSAEEFRLIRNSIFMEDEDETILARTRFSEDSARIAILPVELYEQVNYILKQKHIIPSGLAKQVMRYSISVHRQMLSSFEKMCGERIRRIDGTGKLCGVSLYCASEMKADPTESLSVQADGIYMKADRRIGLIMGKEGEEQ